jgi:peroxiredoxin
LRERYDELRDLGGEVIAIGTGNVPYAAAFVTEEHVPFPVLVDDAGAAARAAQVKRVNFYRLLFDRRSLAGAREARAAGHRIHKPGKRTNQLGATFVIGPGDRVQYEHVDDHTADHASLADVLDALRKASGVTGTAR